MKKILLRIVFIVLLVATIGLATADIIVTVRNYETKNSILETYRSMSEKDRNSEEGKALLAEVETWQTNTRDRAFKLGFMLLFDGIVLFFVLYTGRAPQERKRITKEEALVLAEEFERSYQEQGISTVNDNEEPEEELDETELPQVLKRPKILLLQFSNRGVILQWKKVKYAQAYTIWRRYDKEPWTKIAEVDQAEKIYVDYAIGDHREYFYSVKAYVLTEEGRINSPANKLGKGVFVEEGNILPAPQMHVEEREGERYLVWEPVEGATGYRIMRRTDQKKWKERKSVSAKRLYYKDSKPIADTTNYYAVCTLRKINRVEIAGEYDKEGITLL